MAFGPKDLLDWIDVIQDTIATEDKTATITKLKELQSLLNGQLGFIRLGKALKVLIKDEEALSDRGDTLVSFRNAVSANYTFTDKFKANADKKLSAITITVGKGEVAPWDDTITVSIGEKTPKRVAPVKSKINEALAKSIKAATTVGQQMYKKQQPMTEQSAAAAAAAGKGTTPTKVNIKPGDGRKA